MTEFGHTSIAISGGRADLWGSGPFAIDVNGRTHRFVDSERFGPERLRADGCDAARLWGESHPFWAAHHRWVGQGRRLADDGETCVVDP